MDFSVIGYVAFTLQVQFLYFVQHIENIFIHLMNFDISYIFGNSPFICDTFAK